MYDEWWMRQGSSPNREFDALDRLTSTVRPLGIAVSYDYDKNSRLKSLTDTHNNKTQYSYDALGRPTVVSYQDGTSITYGEYDGTGNATRIVEPRGSVVTQSFDSVGRLRERGIQPGAGVEGVTSESFAYDGLGRITEARSGDLFDAPVRFPVTPRVGRNSGQDNQISP